MANLWGMDRLFTKGGMSAQSSVLKQALNTNVPSQTQNSGAPWKLTSLFFFSEGQNSLGGL